MKKILEITKIIKIRHLANMKQAKSFPDYMFISTQPVIRLWFMVTFQHEVKNHENAPERSKQQTLHRPTPRQ